MDEDDAQTLIAKSYAQVNVWRLRLHHPCVPEPGSDLHCDDLVDALRTYSPSQLSYAALGSARDHLGSFHEHVQNRQLHPFADQSLLRTAISSSANACWLLAPATMEQRVKRARCFAAETLKYHVQYLKNTAGFVGLTPTEQSRNLEVLTAAQDVQSRLSELRADADERTTFNQTAVIEVAVSDAFKTQDGNALSREALAEWQRSSGAAHGLSWSILGIPSTRQVSDTDNNGVATFAAGGSFASVVNAHQLALLLSKHAWQLFDQRLKVEV